MEFSRRTGRSECEKRFVPLPLMRNMREGERQAFHFHLLFQHYVLSLSTQFMISPMGSAIRSYKVGLALWVN